MRALNHNVLYFYTSLSFSDLGQSDEAHEMMQQSSEVDEAHKGKHTLNC